MDMVVNSGHMVINSGHMVVNSGLNRQIHKEIVVNNGQW